MSAVSLPRRLATLMIATDVGFIAYWLIVTLHLLPADYLYNDYADPMMVDWNWSFLAIDLLVAGTGFSALLAARRGRPESTGLALISLTLTAASGLMALSFWTLRRDFDPAWWLPNAFLLVYPLPFLRRLVLAAGR